MSKFTFILGDEIVIKDDPKICPVFRGQVGIIDAIRDTNITVRIRRDIRDLSCDLDDGILVVIEHGYYDHMRKF